MCDNICCVVDINNVTLDSIYSIYGTLCNLHIPLNMHTLFSSTFLN